MKLTPGMQQYMNIKEQHPDCLVLFRMGDFYETFYEDAKIAAKELNIVLTARGKGDFRAPLAGIPYHALDQYLAKLIKAGYKVALVEQLEDPKLAKGIVKRGVARIITPGTVMESFILDDNKNNYILAISKDQERYGISIADISTGEFMTSQVEGFERLEAEISRFNPSEIIIPLSQETNKLLSQLKKIAGINTYDDRHFWKEKSYKELTEHFNVVNLQGYGIEDKELCISSSGALLSYLKETQKTSLLHINKLKSFSTKEYMILDSSTIRNLEVIRNIKDSSTRFTLFEALDNTMTAMGARLLRQWLQLPLLDIEKIKERQEAVSELCSNVLLREDIKALLNKISDIERLISKVNYGNANPRDLLGLKNSLKVIPHIKDLLTNRSSKLLNSISRIDGLPQIAELIERSIKEDPPIIIREGKIIKEGYNEELDNLRKITKSGKAYIAQLESKEKEMTGIKSLKIRYNRVFGYFIEVTKPNLHLVPKNYIRKQTQVNSERFITDDLKEQESLILGAEEKINALEYQIFMEIISKVSESTVKIQDAAKNISELDVISSLADIAADNNYTKPQVNNSDEIIIKDGRHPVIERIETQYIPNDSHLSARNRLHIITGPNMSGKSSYMRQVALITLLAQIGSFVPASQATIGVVDRIFTRVGAYDDLTHGQSTFMVEMNETANILNNATENSLVILDEIGRGTSTFDGISIAWAVGEYLNNNIRCKTLFATHYHQLNKLAEIFPDVKNFNISVKEDTGNIIFLHKLIEGWTDKSYGIHVAKLAGIPKEVIDQSKIIMHRLEKDDDINERIHQESHKSGNIIKDEKEEVQKSLLGL